MGARSPPRIHPLSALLLIYILTCCSGIGSFLKNEDESKLVDQEASVHFFSRQTKQVHIRGHQTPKGGQSQAGEGDKGNLAKGRNTNKQEKVQDTPKDPQSLGQSSAVDDRKGKTDHTRPGHNVKKSPGKNESLAGNESIADKTDQAARHTLSKAKGMSISDMVRKDSELAKDLLLPGKRPVMKGRGVELFFVLAAILWLAFYKGFIYAGDGKKDSKDRWSAADHPHVTARKNDPRISMHQPDLVLVFHKPDFVYGDGDKVVPQQHMELLLQGEGKLPRTERLGKEVATRQAVREALLQDIYKVLPVIGFEVNIFSSVDNDELFVCIALKHEPTIRQLLQLHSLSLQIQPSVVESLGIGQKSHEPASSPPYIEYESGLSANVLGEGKTDLDFYKVYGQHHTEGGLILGASQRIQCIVECLESMINLDYAVQEGLIVQWFPSHGAVRVGELQSSWARWRLMTDLSVAQPVDKIHDYFGSLVAFIFAWNGTYCKWLLALTPIALVFEFANRVSVVPAVLGWWVTGSVMGFSIIVAVWGRMAANVWSSDEQYLKTLWDLDGDNKAKHIRPDFIGTLKPAVVDTNAEEFFYEPWKYNLRMSMSFLVTFAFCALDFTVVIMWLDLFDGRLNIVASVVQALIVQVFTQIFNVMAEQLSIAENHKYQKEFYNSYLIKMFIFQFVNQYSAFFYIAVKMQFTTEGCADGDCLGMIQKQLPTTLLVLIAMRVVQVFLASLTVKFALWWESRQMVSQGLPPPVYSLVEEQAKMVPFGVREQIEVMTCLTLTLGYVLIFGAVAPRIIPLCLVIFVVQLRAGAVMLTTATHRTVPTVADGIGNWANVVKFLLTVGVIFSGYLLVQFSPLFAGVQLLSKLTCLCLYCAFVMMLWIVIDLMLEPHSVKALDLAARRKFVTKKVKEKNDKVVLAHVLRSEQKHTPRSAEKLAAADATPYGKQVEVGEWDHIPKLIEEEKESKALAS